jgi:hypothetical protein
MDAGGVALDHPTRAERQGLQAGKHWRVEELLRGFHGMFAAA